MNNLFFLVILFSSSLNAQLSLYPSSSATAQTFGSFCNDLHSININPSILAYKHRQKMNNTTPNSIKYRLDILKVSTKSESDSLLNLIDNFLYKDSLFVELKSVKKKDFYNIILDNITNHSTVEFYNNLLIENGYETTLIDTFLKNIETIDIDKKYTIIKKEKIQIELLNIGTMLSNSSIDANWLNQFILNGSSKGELQQNNKEEILKVFSREGWNINPIINSKLGFRINNTSLQLSPSIISELTVPSGLMELIFNGNKLSTPIKMSGKKNQFQIILPISISYGGELDLPALRSIFKRSYWGISAKYLGGLAYLESHFDTLNITPNSDNISIKADIVTRYSLSGAFIEIDNNEPFKYSFNTSSISPFPFTGSGYAFDLGLIFDVNNEISTNIALTNFLGNINWSNSQNAYEHRLKFKSNITLDEMQEEPETKIYKGIQIDSNLVMKKLKTKYPGALIIGADLSRNKYNIATNLKFGFNNEIGNSTTPRLSLACRLKPLTFISCLSGLSFGGYENFQWGAGLNLKIFFLQLEFAYSEYGGILGSSKGFSAGLSSSLIF